MVSRKGFCQAVEDMLASLPRSAGRVYRGNEDCGLVKSATLTARCARLGWDIHENTIAKIEAQIRCVTDQESVLLARALGVSLLDVFPKAMLPQKRSSRS